MSRLLQSLLFCAFLHYSRSDDPRVYKDTYHGLQIKMLQPDPERRPFSYLKPGDPIDAHCLLYNRKYLHKISKGPAGGTVREIKRNPEAVDLEHKGLWSWAVEYPEYNPTNIETSNDAKEKALYDVLKNRPWYEPAIGAKRTVKEITFTVHPFYVRPDLDPPFRRISFELPDGYEHTNLNDEDKIQKLIRHPLGRTGVAGIGLLGNHLATLAADLYLIKVHTVWYIPLFNDEGVLVFDFLLINRKDEGGYASPGGVVNPGETPIEAAVREWAEEVTGTATTERVEALKNEIENLSKAISNQAEDVHKKAKEQELNTKRAELAVSKTTVKDECIQKILEESLSKKDDGVWMNRGWCVYKGHAGDRRDSDKARMETVVFAKDVTQTKLDIPDEFSGSEEVKDKPRFIKVTEEWLSKNETFAKHGDYMRMILKYIIPLHSKTLQEILPGAGEGLANAARRAIFKVFHDVTAAIGWLNDSSNVIPLFADAKQQKSKKDILKEIAQEAGEASKVLDSISVALKNVRAERGHDFPKPNSKHDKEALNVGKLAFEIVKSIKTKLAQIPELPPQDSPEAKNNLIKETEALLTRIVAAYQQIQYYVYAKHNNLPDSMDILSGLLHTEFKNFSEALQSNAQITSKDLINAKKILSRAETEIRVLRGLEI